MARVQRVCILGTSGSGKTTLGRELARRMGAASIDLDDLHWAPGWTEVPDEEFRHKLLEALESPSWVTSGNYASVQELYMTHADTMIWLDYSFAVVFGRILKRTFRRVVFREVCCNGNYESWRTTFSRDSIILWVFRTYLKRKRKYGELFSSPEREGVRMIRFRSPHEAQAWLDQVKAAPLGVR
jgi:hypothetical protein